MNPWLSRGLGLAALLLGGWLLLVSTEWAEEQRPRPLPEELAQDGTVMARDHLQRLGLRARRVDDLLQMPSTDATLVLTARHWQLLEGSSARLRAWVEAGGHLVVDAETLETVYVDGDGVNTDGEPGSAWFPMRRVVLKNDPGTSTRPDCRLLRQREGLPPAFGDQGDYVACLGGGGQLSAQAPKGQRPPEPLWVMTNEEHGTEVLRLALGRGRVTAFAGSFEFDQQYGFTIAADGTASVVTNFSNRGLANGDNAALLAALVDARPGREVWLVTRIERPALLLWLWQHGAPALLLAATALALGLWLRSARFGPVRQPPPPARRSVAEQIRGSADFLFRHQPAALHAMALRALEDTAARRLAGWPRTPPQQRAALLARATGLPEMPLAQALSPHGTRAQLTDALMLLETTRRALLNALPTPPREPR